MNQSIVLYTWETKLGVSLPQYAKYEPERETLLHFGEQIPGKWRVRFTHGGICAILCLIAF